MIYKFTDSSEKVVIKDGKLSFIIGDGSAEDSEYQAWLLAGNNPEPADPEPAFVKMISKLTVTDRLIAAGKIEAAIAALNSDQIAMFRWNAATEIASNDAQVRTFLTAIGANPDEILS